MNALHWEDVPANTSQKLQHSSASHNQPLVSQSNPWFGVAMGLIGIIAGFVLANVLH